MSSFHLAYALPKASAMLVLYFVGLVELCRVASGRKAFECGFATGLLIFAPQLYFFFLIFKFAAIPLWCVLALYHGLFVWLGSRAIERFGKWGWWLLPWLWTGLEYFRSELYYLRFSWMNAGYALAWNLPFAPLHWLGMYGVGFVLMALAVAICRMEVNRAAVAVMAAIAGLGMVLNFERETESTTGAAKGPLIAGVQWEFPAEMGIPDELDKVLKKHPETDVLVLSEYTFDGPVQKKVREWCRRNRKYLVVGGKEYLAAKDETTPHPRSLSPLRGEGGTRDASDESESVGGNAPSPRPRMGGEGSARGASGEIEATYENSPRIQKDHGLGDEQKKDSGGIDLRGRRNGARPHPRGEGESIPALMEGSGGNDSRGSKELVKEEGTSSLSNEGGKVGEVAAAGMPTGGDTPQYYNTAFVVGPKGEIVFKQGKKVPIQFFADGLPAKEQVLWDSPWGKIGIGVCYDLSYTRVTDELIRQGAQALIVPMMDVEEWGAHQHGLHSRVGPVRAAEYGVPIFRLASSGISQAVDRNGRVLASGSFPGQGEIVVARMEFSEKGRLPVDRYLVWVGVAVVLFSLGLCLVGGRLKGQGTRESIQ